MRVRLEYGRTGLEVELPDQNVVKCLGYQAQPPLADPAGTLRDRLAHPIDSSPLSASIRMDVPTKGLVMDRIRQIVSVRMGRLDSLSAHPWAS